MRQYKSELPMNTIAFSPLIVDKNDPRYHAIMGGGVSARDAALVKVIWVLVMV